MSFVRFCHSLSIVILLAGLSAGRIARAQDFQPPRPPPLDPATDFEDMEEDMMEMGDEDYRPPGTNPQGNNNGSPNNNYGAPPPPPPPIDHASGSAFGNAAHANKVFQIVEGEFWEKGKKRSRGVMKRLQAPPGS
jgi:hypothetical protein